MGVTKMLGILYRAGLASAALGLVACGSGDYPNFSCGDATTANCVEVAAGDAQGLLEAVNALVDDTTIVLGEGVYEFDNQVTIRGANGVSLIGQGMDETVLSFTQAGVDTQINGVDAVADDFLIQDLQVLDAPKDAIRVENSVGVTYRRVRTTWTEEENSENGAYGIYPVRSRNVLIEGCEALNASDAGLYVGQSINVIVRDNIVRGNVAGLEIENTQFADVYDNLAENNTGGVLIFDLPGNPIVGRDVVIRNNTIRNNNTPNFAPGGVVSELPSGTGLVTFASRRLEIYSNTFEGNNSHDIGLVSGLVLSLYSLDAAANWELETATLEGVWEDLNLPAGSEGTITNYRSENIAVWGNTHTGGGMQWDGTRPLGQLIGISFAGTGRSANVFYDGFEESSPFDADTAANNSNDNHICAGDNVGSFANIDAATQVNTPAAPILFLETPAAPYDCTELDGGRAVVPTMGADGTLQPPATGD
jgi:parallel beta-helix repeat protein